MKATTNIEQENENSKKNKHEACNQNVNMIVHTFKAVKLHQPRNIKVDKLKVVEPREIYARPGHQGERHCERCLDLQIRNVYANNAENVAPKFTIFATQALKSFALHYDEHYWYEDQG
jgi:hypothetical protein